LPFALRARPIVSRRAKGNRLPRSTPKEGLSVTTSTESTMASRRDADPEQVRRFMDDLSAGEAEGDSRTADVGKLASLLAEDENSSVAGREAESRAAPPETSSPPPPPPPKSAATMPRPRLSELAAQSSTSTPSSSLRASAPASAPQPFRAGVSDIPRERSDVPSSESQPTSRRPADYGGAARMFDTPREKSSRRAAGYEGAARMFDTPREKSSQRAAGYDGAAELFKTPEALKEEIRRARAERKSLTSLVHSVRTRGMKLSRATSRLVRTAVSKRRSPIPHIPRGKIDSEALQDVRMKLRKVADAQKSAVAAIEQDVSRSAQGVARQLSVAAAPAPQEQEAPADMLKRLRMKFDALFGAQAAAAPAAPASASPPKKGSAASPPKKGSAASPPKKRSSSAGAKKRSSPAPSPTKKRPATLTKSEKERRGRAKADPRKLIRRFLGRPSPPKSMAEFRAMFATPEKAKKGTAAKRPASLTKSEKERRGRAKADPRKLIRRFLGRPSPPKSLAEFRAMFETPIPARSSSRLKEARAPEARRASKRAATPSPASPAREASRRLSEAGKAVPKAKKARAKARGVKQRKGTRCAPGFHRGPGDLCYPKEAVADVKALIKGKVPARRRRKIERKVGEKLPEGLGFPVPRTLSREPSSLRRMYAREQTVPKGLRVVKSPPSKYRIERRPEAPAPLPAAPRPAAPRPAPPRPRRAPPAVPKRR